MYMLWSASRPGDGEQIFCVAHDISSRKELEQLKQEFLAMVSHDLRTPLTSIVGIAKLIAAGAFGEPDEPVSNAMQGITSEADQLLELINDLLDIEKLEAGKMQLVLEQSSLNEILNKAAEHLAESRRPLIYSGAANKDLSILADSDRLIQAFANVMNFAAGTVAAEPPQLSAKANEVNVLVNIQIKGVQLSPREQSQIFERFKDTGEPGARTCAGSGLAMPIARIIFEEHGGSVAVEQDAEGGTIFSVKLPLASQKQAPVEASSACG
jgi:K+-sensing histidine kinase KdpD